MALSLREAQARFRAQMLARDQATLRELTLAYENAFRSINAAAMRLLAKIEAARAAGEDVSPFWLTRQAQYQSLMHQIEERLDLFARQAGRKITHLQGVQARQGAKDAMRLLDLATPGLDIDFALLPAGTIEALVGTLSDGSPLADLLGQLGPEARKLATSTLINGVAEGTSFRTIGRQLMKGLRLTRNRAMNTVRTESNRAYREASLGTYQANSDVVNGWRWTASLSSRTCPMCLAMDGSIHRNDEEFSSHPSCRCTPVPITDTSRASFTDAGAWLRSQPVETQEAIMGKEAARLYRSGDIQLSDFVRERYHDRWGLIRDTKPLSEMVRRRAA